jgi:hypothetical protein
MGGYICDETKGKSEGSVEPAQKAALVGQKA